MSEMIERVAKAIFDAMDIADGLDGTVAEKYARAAIEAMREPTEEMLDAADGPWCDDDRPELKREYRAMINAALNEKDPAAS